jgi:hypothetical protein
VQQLPDAGPHPPFAHPRRHTLKYNLRFSKIFFAKQTPCEAGIILSTPQYNPESLTKNTLKN